MRRLKAFLLTLLSIAIFVLFPWGVGFVASILIADLGIFSPAVLTSPFSQFGLGIIAILTIGILSFIVYNIVAVIYFLYLKWYDQLEK